jgi:DNA-binding PadR family transcriptional regulator
MSLSYGLLGLLNYAPLSGYDLKKIFDDSINFFWSAQTSQIYRELKALEKQGCVTSVIKISQTGPNKRIYKITKLGAVRLKQWLMNIPDEIGEDNRNEFLMRVFLGSNIGKDELIKQLTSRLDKYRRDQQRLKSLEKNIQKYVSRFNGKNELPFWRISLSRGFHDVTSHIQWAEESIAFLKKLGHK